MTFRLKLAAALQLSNSDEQYWNAPFLSAVESNNKCNSPLQICTCGKSRSQCSSTPCTRVFLGSLDELAPPILSHGGLVSRVYSSDSIHLVPEGYRAPKGDLTHPVYSAAFIPDCVRQKRLLPLEDYRVVPHSRAKDSPCADEPTVQKRPRVSLSDRVTVLPSDLIVTFFADRRPRTVVNISRLRLRATQANVLEAFKRLVHRCQRLSRAGVSELEVLRALLRHKGEVDSTVQEFLG